MSHPAQTDFCRSIRDQFPHFFTGTSVLECGSRNVNGTVRDLFESPSKYVGVDCTPGECVDVVSLFHEYRDDRIYDVVVSCEALEHDPHAPESVEAMVRFLRPGGLLLITCAGFGRVRHGTQHEEGELLGPDPAYYRYVHHGRLSQWLRDAAQWEVLRVEYNAQHRDTYAVGISSGDRR